MTRSEQEFREFVAGFADPLARLAFLLSAGSALDSVDMTVSALAAVRRRWHDVEATGAPEPVAVEALLSALPRLRRGATAADGVAPIDQSPDVEVDEGLLRAAAWAAWNSLAPRQRVPLLLDDMSVAAQRLAGVDIAQTSRSVRRASVVAEGAWRALREATAADGLARRRVVAMAAEAFAALMRDTLREQAAATPKVIEPYPRVRRRLSRTRMRSAGAVAASVIVLVAASAVAIRASAPTKGKVPLVSASAEADSVSDRGPVVAWPTRGTAARDNALISKLKVAFLHAHPETTGQVQVLLVTDTSSYRLAYVTAKSPTGVLESWFYGSVGSSDLVEGVAQYGGGLDARTEVLATGLVDAQGHTQLVVLAPPGTRTMRLTTADGSASHPALRAVNGAAATSVPTGSVAALRLDVRVGRTDVVSTDMRTLPLGPTLQGVAAPFEPLGAPSLHAERGQPDPLVLTHAVYFTGLLAWQGGGPDDVQLKVLWGGSDALARRIVVIRMDMELSDTLLVTWEDPADVPRQMIEAIAPGTPDAPLAFAYGYDGPRVAVLGTTGDSAATLSFNGKQLAAAALDSTGFASFPVTDVSRLTSPGLAVNLLGPVGNVLKTIPILAS